MGRSKAFVSCRGGGGKSTTVAQLGAALASARPDLTVIIIDASLHADATHALVGGMQEPAAEARAATCRGEEIRKAHSARSTAALLKALSAPPPPSSPWLRLTGGGARGGGRPTAWEDFWLSPAEVHPDGAAPANLRVVAGGANLKDVTSDEAGRARTALSALMASSPDTHVFLLDTDAELAERPASSAAAGAAAELAVVLSSNWSDALRAFRDPINGVTEALKSLPEPSISRVVFARVAKHRNGVSSLSGADVLGFKPVAAAATNMEAILSYVHERAQVDSDLAPFFRGADGADVSAFAENAVLAVPDLPETVIAHSVLYGAPVVSMAPGGGVSADALAAAQEALRFAAARLF